MDDQPTDELIRASELDKFLYCERSWWYAERGIKGQRSAEMKHGEREHQRLAQAAQTVTGAPQAKPNAPPVQGAPARPFTVQQQREHIKAHERRMIGVWIGLLVVIAVVIVVLMGGAL